MLSVSYLCQLCATTFCTIIQYTPRNMHRVFALLCFVVVIHWLILPYPSGLLHWHCGNLTIAPVPAKQPWWIWINTSCEFIMNDYITTTKQSTTKPCAYFLGYTVYVGKQCIQMHSTMHFTYEYIAQVLKILRAIVPYRKIFPLPVSSASNVHWLTAAATTYIGS